MPIELDLWRRLLEGALKRLSDADFQKRAWFNNHKEQTSPEEQLCQLLGDYDLEEYVSSPNVKLSPHLKLKVDNYISRLKSYGGDNQMPFDPHKVIEDPEWKAIQIESGTVLRLLFGHEGSGELGSE
jgi:hypothetical protein